MMIPLEEAFVIISSRLSKVFVYTRISEGYFLVTLSFHLTLISLSSMSMMFLQYYDELLYLIL